MIQARGALLAIVLVAIASGTPKPADARVPSTWRVVAAPHPVRDALGHRWRNDHDLAFGGTVTAIGESGSDTDSPQLYRARRSGVRAVSLPVRRAGTYAVVMYLAGGHGTAAGRRIFDVLAEGQEVAHAVDNEATDGDRRPDHLVFTVPVTDGRLTLRFRARVGEPQFSALKVTPMRRSTKAPSVVWHDEFDGPAGESPAMTRWTFDRGVGHIPGWGNHELEIYTERTENAALTGTGALAITARRERFTGKAGKTRDYTSARIKTQGTFAFKYGEAAARIQVPAGVGLWPAFWAVGDDVYDVGWPVSGEFDVMEVLDSDPTSVWGSVHGPQLGGGSYARSRRLTPGGSLAGAFHVYSAQWVPGAIQMRLDGQRYATYTAEDLGARRRWVYDHRFHLLLNLAVGGKSAGSPTSKMPFPATMLVDWVRVTR